jgi:hypothetical protein
MTETGDQAVEPAIITVGEMIAELKRWPAHAALNFRCPLLEQELRFYRVQHRSNDVVEIELNLYPETPPVVPA